MTFITRRSLLQHCVAVAPMLAHAQIVAPAAGVGTTDLVDAWRMGFAVPDGRPFAWWYAGTVYAHVDGLREFPVLALNTVRICRASMLADATVVDWHTVGYFTDLQSGEPATHWNNVFTGERVPVPSRLLEGPGRYRLSTLDAVLSMTATDARTNRATLTGAVTATGTLLTQIEGSLQGLPRLDGRLPPLDSPDVTELQTRLQILIPGSGRSRLASRNVSGFFNHVYDALPPWLGFGDRLGSMLSKGVMQKARADEVVNREVRSAIQRLFGNTFMTRRLDSYR